MDTTARAAEPSRALWRSVARVGVTLAAVGAIGLWMLVSFFLWGFRCDESCGVGDAEHWRWTGQLVLSVLGGSLGVVALTLGFTSRRRAYKPLLALSAGCAILWIGWVFGSGTF